MMVQRGTRTDLQRRAEQVLAKHRASERTYRVARAQRPSANIVRRLADACLRTSQVVSCVLA
jgi:hypothetical protein